MHVDVTLMITSVGSWILGSGTVSHRTSPLPCQHSAFMRVSSGERKKGRVTECVMSLGVRTSIGDKRESGLSSLGPPHALKTRDLPLLVGRLAAGVVRVVPLVLLLVLVR